MTRVALCVLMLASVTAPLAAHADLATTDSYSVQYEYNGRGFGDTVTGELPESGGLYTGFSVDLTASQITISQDIQNGFASGAEIVLTDLSGPIGVDSVTLDASSNNPEFGTSAVSFTSNEIIFSVAGGTYRGQTEVFDFSPAISATPEPSGLLLAATGMLGIAGLMRRRVVGR